MDFKTPNTQSTHPKEDLAINKPSEGMFWRPEQIGDLIEGVWVSDYIQTDAKGNVKKSPRFSTAPELYKVLPNHKVITDTFYDEQSRCVVGRSYRIVCSNISFDNEGKAKSYSYEVYDITN